MQRILVPLAALIGGAAFLFMVKLMYDMTGHMGRMADQVALMSADLGHMRGQMETLSGHVGAMAQAVGHMPALAADVRGIRENVGAMAGVVQSTGEKIERINPMDMMQQVVPGTRR